MLMSVSNSKMIVDIFHKHLPNYSITTFSHIRLQKSKSNTDQIMLQSRSYQYATDKRFLTKHNACSVNTLALINYDEILRNILTHVASCNISLGSFLLASMTSMPTIFPSLSKSKLIIPLISLGSQG